MKTHRVITDFIYNGSARFGHKIALKFENQSYTYKDLEDSTNKLAAYLEKLTQPQEVIAILIPNSPEFLFAYFGVLRSKNIALLLAPNIADEKLQFQILKTNAKNILTVPKYFDKLARSLKKEDIRIIDVTDLHLEISQPSRDVVPEDISTVIFTSGTSAAPKGVKLQHKNVVAATQNICTFLDFNENDVDVNISALSHSFGLGHIHCIFSVGGTTILFKDSINLKSILSTIIDHKATTFGAVPAILRLIIANMPELFSQCDKTLRFVQTNTSPLESKLIKAMLRILPTTKFAYYYGLTEASRSTFMFYNDHPTKHDSVGQASPNVDVKILTSTNKQVPTDHPGEICIKGDSVIKEYWENPEASNKIKGEWFHTGDFGRMDEDGFLYYIGRVDDVINVAGEKVSPEEVEQVIAKLEDVEDVAVIGVSDKLLGAVVKAFVKKKANAKLSTTDIIQHCRQHLSNFMVPKHVDFIEKIPRTDNGKLQRNKLKGTYKQ